MAVIGKGVNVTVKGDVLTVTIDLSKGFGPSGSGKSAIVATTSGNKPVPGTDVVLGFNLYRPN